MRPFDSFVMFASMRTGSNFLEQNLNALADVTCHGEAFNPHFIGQKQFTSQFGWDLDARDADPAGFISRMRRKTEGLAGFRYFHDHDPRVFDPVMDDPRCAKIVLTRNPLDSYVSWRTAMATGQWKMTHATHERRAKVRFEPAEFMAFLDVLQGFHLRILAGLQRRGQTGFWLDYDDLTDLDVLNGLAAWLGSRARLDAPDQTLKKQNPGSVLDRIENPEDLLATVARIDWLTLSRTPTFEPRRAAALPSWMAAGDLLFLPIPGGPTDVVEAWLAQVGEVQRDFDQRRLAQWRRGRAGCRAFTVLRHPVARAQAILTQVILPGHMAGLRNAMGRTLKIDLPAPDAALSAAEERDLLLAWLRFVRMVLSGQTAIKVHPQVASQGAILQGFAAVQSPDLVLREAQMAQGLAFAAASLGVACPPPPPAGPQVAWDDDIVAAAHEAYGRDYATFGFGDG